MTDNPFECSFEDLPAELPLFPLNGVLLLPRGRLPLNIFEPRYLNMIEHALGRQRLVGIVQPMVDGQAGLSAPDGTALYGAGCAGRITNFQETTGGQIQLTLRGVCRFGIVDELPLAQATVSQHLKAPKAAGLVVGKVEGPCTCYCLNAAELQRFREAFETLFDEMSHAAASCC